MSASESSKMLPSERQHSKARVKVKVKQSDKFTSFSKLISTLIKKYLTNMINVNVLKKKRMFCYSFWSKGATILQYNRVTSQGWFALLDSKVI